MNKKGLTELKKKRNHRKWRYEQLKEKILRRKPNWKP